LSSSAPRLKPESAGQKWSISDRREAVHEFFVELAAVLWQ
jgi:hypothetical protein